VELPPLFPLLWLVWHVYDWFGIMRGGWLLGGGGGGPVRGWWLFGKGVYSATALVSGGTDFCGLSDECVANVVKDWVV
jgi:hypothetical protein